MMSPPVPYEAVNNALDVIAGPYYTTSASAMTANNLVRRFLARLRPLCIGPSLGIEGIFVRRMATILAVVSPGLFEDGRGGFVDSCRCCTVGSYKGNFDHGLFIVGISCLLSVVYKYKACLVW